MSGTDEPLSTASLAYLGDAVFELCVRDMLTAQAGQTLQGFNEQARRYVAARNQAALYHRIFDALTPDEQAVLRRGRNLNPASRAKNASMTDYRHATGLETLFGHLYATGQGERLREVFALCIDESINESIDESVKG